MVSLSNHPRHSRLRPTIPASPVIPTSPVIPAKAGIQSARQGTRWGWRMRDAWIPSPSMGKR